MEFKDFFQLMKNRISDGLDVPAFFRDLVAMITDVTEEARDTPKDPSSKLTKENTLRTYAKRGLSAKFAKSIVYNLSPEDYKGYDTTATADNIAGKLADCFQPPTMEQRFLSMRLEL